MGGRFSKPTSGSYEAFEETGNVASEDPSTGAAAGSEEETDLGAEAAPGTSVDHGSMAPDHSQDLQQDARSDDHDEGGTDAENFLKAFESADHDRALELVRNASAVEINSEDHAEVRRVMLIAAMEGHIEVVRDLLAREDFEGVNATDLIGSTALHLAAGNDQVEVCELLLASPRYMAFTSVNAVNSHGRTPFDFAQEFGNGEAADVLRAAGATGGGKAPRKSGRWTIPPTTIEPDEPGDESEQGVDSSDVKIDEPVADMYELD